MDMVNVSVSHVVSCWFTSRPGHTKDQIIKMELNGLPAWQAGLIVTVWLFNCVKGLVVCGTV